MSLTSGKQILLASAAEGRPYTTAQRSLRFNSPDSAYLERNFGSAGSQTTFTWSAWVKRSKLSGDNCIFDAHNVGNTNYAYIEFNSSGNLVAESYNGSVQFSFTTTPVYRDTSAWYHIVFVADTTNSTSSDRVKLYVNNERITTFSSVTYPSSGASLIFNSGNPHELGSLYGTTWYFGGYMAFVHFIDGQALTPSSFAGTDATTGQWIPKSYVGAYGSKGFFLSFLDNADTSAVAKDSSGNSNNWACNNISVNPGAGNDSTRDNPVSIGTNTGAGGEVSGNYCVLNLLQVNGSTANISDSSLTDGNLVATNNSSTAWDCRVGTLGVSTGKWYYEYVVGVTVTNFLGGWADASNLHFTDAVGNTSRSYGYYNTGNTRNNNSSSATNYGSYTTGDVISCAIDLDNAKIYWAKNGTWINSANPASGTGSIYTVTTGYTYFPAVSTYDSTQTVTCNFGQRPFAYTAPTGFLPLVDTLFTTPTIIKPNTAMDVVTWSLTTSITMNMGPDFVWMKRRNSVGNHALIDTVRTNTKHLESDSAGAEQTEATPYISSFNSDGFSLSAGTIFNNGNSYVGWCWDAGTNGNTTNTNGTITSTVRANTSAGFSIVTYTGTGSNATVGHGLGAAPAFILGKNRDSGAFAWRVYHSSLGATQTIYLNLTNAAVTDTDPWNNTAPTSTLITLLGGGAINRSAQGSVLYCWTPVAGYSAFGSYVGNGSSDGTFVYTGFKPRWIMLKSSSTGGVSGYDWIIYDTSRSTYNLNDTQLIANSSVAENTDSSGSSTVGIGIDVLSNGFKQRLNSGGRNSSGVTYIYAAFAEAPFQYARAR